MSDTLTLKATKVERPPDGTHHAVLQNVVDLGLQPGFASKPGEKVKPQHKLVLCFELARKRADGISRYEVSQICTASLNEKSTLRKFVKGLLGRDVKENEAISIPDLIGTNCAVVLSTKEGKNGPTTVIEAVSRPIEGTETIAPYHDTDYSPPWVLKMISQQILPEDIPI